MFPSNDRKILAYLMPLLFVVLPWQAKSQWQWGFEKALNYEVEEAKTRVPLRLGDTSFKPELVAGVQGKGLRTNGYSSWIEGKLPATIKGSFTISGWFALETFPTDTAGFFSLSNANAGTWVSACVDRFGRFLIGNGHDKNFHYTSPSGQLKKFQWIHVALSLEKTQAQLFINGEKLLSASLPDGVSATEWNYLRVGKDEPVRKIIGYPVNVLNGIMDELSVTPKASTEHDFAKSDLQKGLLKKPDLSVPVGRFINDFNRPQYHLLPAANWTNETHGLIYHNGRYRIFNQKNGNNILLRQINWGHFSSPDLVNWIEHRPALAPEPGFDNLGIWSGHAVVDEKGIPVLIYTGGNELKNGIGLAYPKDSSLLEWEKYSGNPVIYGQPEGYARTDLRDPYVFKEGAMWYMIIGFGLVENNIEKGTVLLYKSPDLKSWQFLHPLFVGDPANDDSGVFWEMPVFWKLNNRYILLVNKVPYKGQPAVSLYWTGKFENEKFVADVQQPKRLEVVNRLLSPSVAIDADGKTTAIAIIPDEIRADANYRQGWAHVYSIPRVWTLHDGTIHQQPHPAMKKLRLDSTKIKEKTVTPTAPLLMSKGKHQVEIRAQVLVKDCEKFGLVIGKNSERGEMTKIYLDIKNAQVVVDQTKSSKRKGIPLSKRSGAYTIPPNEVIDLHLFIDGSVVEVFINGKDAFTTRFFPQYADSSEVEIFSEGGSLQVVKAEIWSLKKGMVQNRF